MNQKNVTLVIMAAGMSTRFGKLKQLEIVGPNDETLIDYAIYDALQIGIQKITLVVRALFHNQIKHRYEQKWKSQNVSFTFINQELSDVPDFYEVQNREKPWGTTHVLYTLRNHLKNPFIIMNADDFYGRETLKSLRENLVHNHDEKTQFMTIYKLKNTLSNFGAVTRGICSQKNGYLENIIETKNVQLKNKKVYSEDKEIDTDSFVSMNIWGLSPHFIQYSVSEVNEFFKSQPHPKSEVLLPVTIQKAIKSKEIKVKVLQSSQETIGMTFKEDLQLVKNFILNLIKNGEYPHSLT